MASNNSLYFLGAAVVGIVSAAGVFIVEHLRQERRRHVMAQDLARLDQQLCGMRKELEQLRQLQKDRNAQRIRKNKHQNSRPLSSVSSASDDYNSALEVDSSDLEFYDLSEDEDTADTVTVLDQILKEIDNKINSSDVETLKETLNKLTDLCMDFPENAELLWRLGKVHHKISTSCTDKLTMEDLTMKGIAACESALKINPNIADTHKWYAILIGSRANMQPIKGKISDGFLFKKHLDEAVKLDPGDATLHHLLGRFEYETAILKWYERKVATTFFAEPPKGSLDKALQYTLSAERLTETDWKENKLLIAKCQIAMGSYKEAVESLIKADHMRNDGCLDVTVESEIKTLLQQYNSYR